MDHPEKIGNYLVVKHCGGGGFGQVYECIERSTGQIVAIKRILKANGGSNVEREKEIVTHPGLKHPNIVNHRHIFSEREYTCIVMDYYPLGDLDSILGVYKKYNENVPEDFVRFVGQQVVFGLLVLLEHNFSHRDLKPPNLFLDTDKGLSVRMGDFGIAKGIGSSNTAITSTVTQGSVGFASPEVLGAGELCPASDIFSLGCILYTLMAGFPPYTGANAWAYTTAVQKGVYKAIQTIKKGIYSKELTVLVDQMLMIDPVLRPTAIALSTDVSLQPSSHFTHSLSYSGSSSFSSSSSSSSSSVPISIFPPIPSSSSFSSSPSSEISSLLEKLKIANEEKDATRKENEKTKKEVESSKKENERLKGLLEAANKQISSSSSLYSFLNLWVPNRDEKKDFLISLDGKKMMGAPGYLVVRPFIYNMKINKDIWKMSIKIDYLPSIYGVALGAVASRLKSYYNNKAIGSFG